MPSPRKSNRSSGPIKPGSATNCPLDPHGQGLILLYRQVRQHSCGHSLKSLKNVGFSPRMKRETRSLPVPATGQRTELHFLTFLLPGSGVEGRTRGRRGLARPPRSAGSCGEGRWWGSTRGETPRKERERPQTQIHDQMDQL